MNNRVLVLAILFGSLFVLAGCGKSSQKTTQKTHLAMPDVLKISEATAKSEGFDTSKYNMTGCHYEYTATDKTWTVFYELKPPTPPGGHFMVSVEDQTEKAALSRGE
jgi:hypothetical protein